MQAAFRRGQIAASIGRANRHARTPIVLVAMIFAAACSDAVTGPFDPSDPSTAKDGSKGKPRQEEPPPSEPTPLSSSPNPLAGLSFYLDPSSNARKQADEWKLTRPADAEQMERIAIQPQAKWIGSWLDDPMTEVANAIAAASKQGTVAVLVAYNITNLDCGSGGATPDAYRTWISRFAAAIGGTRALVILEPDALPALGCLSSAQQQVRLGLLRFAVQALKAQSGPIVYLDAGHASWQSAATMADRLSLAGVAAADGFSLNVSNFGWTSANASYGADISGRIGGKRFVIDTSRNGLGPTADYQWCNPDGRALGPVPTTATGHALVDAYLWIKPPGESDGPCNGGPRAGGWWPEYALGLVQRS